MAGWVEGRKQCGWVVSGRVGGGQKTVWVGSECKGGWRVDNSVGG